jgi:hypothetical protein
VLRGLVSGDLVERFISLIKLRFVSDYQNYLLQNVVADDSADNALIEFPQNEPQDCS